MNKIESEENFKKWTPIIKKCRNSGIGVRPWCRQNNISEKKFYYWERRIKGKNFEIQEENKLPNQANFIELPVPIESSVNKSTPTFRADMVIQVGNNVLEISNTVSENLLSMVLKVMSNVK